MTATPADPCTAPDLDVEVRHWRPPGSAALGGATAVGLLALGLAAVVETPGRTTAAALAAAVLGAWACVAVLVRPRLTAGPDGLVIRNPLHTVHVPWADLRGVDTGVSLSVRTDTRRITVWAVPAHLGRPRRRTAFGLRVASRPAALPPRRRTAGFHVAPAAGRDGHRGRRVSADRRDHEMAFVAEQLRTRWQLRHPSTAPAYDGPGTPGPGAAAVSTTVRTWPGTAVPPLILAALVILLR